MAEFETDKLAQDSLCAQLRADFLHTDPAQMAKREVRAFVEQALAAAQQNGSLPATPAPAFVVEQPADPKNGDLSANLALVSAKAFGMAPRQIAQAVVGAAPPGGHSMIERVEIAGPGFINVFFSGAWFAGAVMNAVVCGTHYGRTDGGAGEKVNVEYVSANPTGPMHLGNARGGALGDCLAAVLSAAGYDVTREFYINDAGNQIAKFGRSLSARYLQIIRGEDAVEFPEDGYQGEDIRQRAREFYNVYGAAFAEKDAAELEQALVDYALPRNIEGLKADLRTYRIEYDVWSAESRLHGSGAVTDAVRLLAERGATYEKEGALWFCAPKGSGDEKDEVLVRANGVPTYFAADIAYHIDKFKRGFTRLIDVWGADHHGHVARMKSALQAAGYRPECFDVVLMQFVRLVRNGQPVRMSKRTGKAITLTDLLEEVPIDSARFFFNLREPGSSIEFDLDLAVAEDSDNPVYYVQYAHARTCSILRALAEDGVSFEAKAAFGALRLLTHAAERELIRKVAAFPGEVAAAAAAYDPARVTRYLVEVATAFHRFYTACRIKGEQAGLLQARLALALAAKTVLHNGLSMFKVSAPERM